MPKESDTLTYPKARGTAWALTTGALKAANVNNIYDMAGNMWEWTVEGYDANNYRVIRGGYFSLTSSYCPVSFRSYNAPNNPLNGNTYLGFRSSPYIK